LPIPAHSSADTAKEDVVDGERVQEAKAPAPLGQTKIAGQHSVTSRQAGGADHIGFRKLFADPGLPRVVELGKFRQALAPQLGHPERLRDVHRLACYVQVYEVLRQQRAHEFLEAIKRDGQMNVHIQVLSEESSAILGLKEFVARHPRPPRNPLRESGDVLPFECFYSLQVSSDPTAGRMEAREAGALTARGSDEECNPPAPPAASSPQPKTPSLCRNIPERFQNPWEFQLSRDEVLYDMNARAALRTSVTTLLSKVGRWFHRREEFRKWRALLSVKEPGEQLWAVRPPRGSVSDPSVREWARQTLDDAGYDSRTMLREWEIFWRRKGV
jgi:hypothetical protein